MLMVYVACRWQENFCRQDFVVNPVCLAASSHQRRFPSDHPPRELPRGRQGDWWAGLTQLLLPAPGIPEDACEKIALRRCWNWKWGPLCNEGGGGGGGWGRFRGWHCKKCCGLVGTAPERQWTWGSFIQHTLIFLMMTVCYLLRSCLVPARDWHSVPRSLIAFYPPTKWRVFLEGLWSFPGSHWAPSEVPCATGTVES